VDEIFIKNQIKCVTNLFDTTVLQYKFIRPIINASVSKRYREVIHDLSIAEMSGDLPRARHRARRHQAGEHHVHDVQLAGAD
jgi:hypothetical protein